MRFEWPFMLWLLPLLGWWLWRRHRQPDVAVEYSSLELVTGGSESWRIRWAWLPEALRVIALLILIMALARPQWESAGYSRQTYGVGIELLVDISSSMDMAIPGGERLTRLGAVKDVLQRFILGDRQGLPGRHNDLIGLVAFARYADTICPQTAAHDALAEIVRNLTIEDRPNEDGTAYGDAVTLAAARLRQLDEPANRADPGAKVKSRVIVLLTDGENNCGRHLPLEAIALAKEWGIRIYVISLANAGSVAGLAQDPAAPPSAAEQILMRMAGETGGLYRRAGDVDSLQTIYREIDALEKSEIRLEQFSEWREFFPFCAGTALFLVIVEMLLRSTFLRRIP